MYLNVPNRAERGTSAADDFWKVGGAWQGWPRESNMWSMLECFCFIVGESDSEPAVCIAFPCVFIGIGSGEQVF